MCYYFLDKTIDYARGLQSFSNFVYFNPHEVGSNSHYNGTTVTLADGDNGHNEANPDHGEDAMVILHEGFHFIHHSLAGIPPPGKSYLSLGAEGVGKELPIIGLYQKSMRKINLRIMKTDFMEFFVGQIIILVQFHLGCIHQLIDSQILH